MHRLAASYPQGLMICRVTAPPLVSCMSRTDIQPFTTISPWGEGGSAISSEHRRQQTSLHKQVFRDKSLILQVLLNNSERLRL